MNFLLWIVSGGVAGWLASVLIGNDAGLGIIGNVIVGIVGAFLGGFIMDKLGHGGAEGAERPTSLLPFVTAVGGSVLLLFILNLFF